MAHSRFLVCGALALSCAPTLAQQVVLYGRADMSLSYQRRIFVGGRVTDQSIKAADSGGYAGSRVGFRGTEDLGGGQRALFVLEQGVQMDTGVLGQGNRAFGRQAYVGLEGQWGRLTLGRQYTPWFDTLSTADPFINSMVGNSGNLEFANARVDNAVLYRTPVLGGFTGQVLAAAGEGTLGRQLNVSGGYQAGRLWVGAAWGEYRFASTGTFGLVGANYDFGPVKVFGNYTKLRNLDPTQQAAPVLASGARGSSWLVGASSTFGANTLMASIIGLNDERAVNRDARQYAVGYLYALSRRTSLYAGGARIVNRNGGVLTVNTPSYPGRGEVQVQAGVTHTF